MIRTIIAFLLSCSVALAGQGMGPGPGVKGYATGGGGTVEATGTAVGVAGGTNSGSTSITVPSDATLAVIFYMGSLDGVDNQFNDGMATLSINSVAATWRGRTTAGADRMDGAVYTLANPSTGTQTFSWTTTPGIITGPGFAIVFYKGVDTANPVLDVDQCSADSGSCTTPSMTTGTGSMTVAAGMTYATTNDMSGSSQTVLINNLQVGNDTTYMDVAQKSGASTMTGSQTGTSWLGIIAISLKAN